MTLNLFIKNTQKLIPSARVVLNKYFDATKMGNTALNYSSSSTIKDMDIFTKDSLPKPTKEFDKKELKSRLTPLQFNVTQEKGTERPFTGEYVYEKDKGIFNCIVCNEQIFDSKTKFESGTGWPSFFDVINTNNVSLVEDKSYGMRRIEVLCGSCGSHMGHLFNDGPSPTNLRYCINSASLSFQPDKK